MKNLITDIFFDLDHTLWDFDANSKSAFKKLLIRHNLPVSIQDYCEVYKEINTKYWQEYSAGKKTKQEVKYGRFKDTFKTLNIPTNPDFIEKFAGEYLEFLKEETKLIEGATEILDYLKDKYSLHILTNGFIEIQERKIKKSGLNNYFDHIISSEETGKQKPHPEVFKYALNKTGAFAHKSLMIGDNFKSDILGAKNAGMHAIHFDIHGDSKVDSKIIPKVEKLIEIKEML